MNDTQELDVVILAGGFGTRLRELVSDRPKVLAPVNGRPFLLFLLDQLLVSGINKVILCTGYLGEQLETFLGESYKSLQILYSSEQIPLGTAGALKQASHLFCTELVLVMNGDSFVDINCQEFIAWHRAKNTQFSITITSVEDATGYGLVELGPDEKIVSFVEKGDVISTNSTLINAGMYLMHKSVIDALPPLLQLSLEEEVLPAAVETGLFGYRTTGRFIDIGTPRSFLSAAKFFESAHSRVR